MNLMMKFINTVHEIENNVFKKSIVSLPNF